MGDLTLSEEQGSLVALDWGWGRDQQQTKLLARVALRLHAYFDGARDDFADIPLAPAGTPYSRRTWAALRAIPPGEVRTYVEIARAAGGSPRSVGQANRRNPIPVIIPCHRVVAVSGLGGYSGLGGLDTKRHLLRLEGYRHE